MTILLKLKELDRIEKLNAIQDEAVNALKKDNYVGTLKLATGVGKSMTSLKAIHKMYKDGILVKGDTISLLAEEVRARERTFFEQEIPKYKKLFGFDILHHFDIKFNHYNTFARNNVQPKVLILDEADCAFSQERIKLFDKNVPYIIGLTGTTADTSPVYRDKSEQGFRQTDFETKAKLVTDFANKGQCFQIFCPIVYEYGMEDGIKNEILSDFRTTIITHNLDNYNNCIQITKKWKGTEQKYYSFWMRTIFKPRFNQGFRSKMLSKEIPRFLYKLPSKINLAKLIIPHLKGRKTLIFARELEFLRQLTPNVAEDYYIINGKKVTDLPAWKRKNNINTRKRLKIGANGIEEYCKVSAEEILDKFDEGKIDIVASSKRLQRGITLKGLNTLVIFVSSKQYDTLAQMLGRLVRWEKGKIGEVIIVITKGTMEEKWYEESRKIKNYKNKVVGNLDMREYRIIDGHSLRLENFRLW